MATFRGFSEFADLSSSTTRAVARARRGGPQKNEEEGDRPPSSSSSAAPALLRPSPVYAGSDEGLALLFRKVGKRDPKTKARALEELAAAAFPPAGADNTAASSPATALPRRERAAVLAALAHQHASRLGHDNAAAVRAASWAALAAARRHVPRAWGALFLGLPPGGDGAAANDDDHHHSNNRNNNASECWVAGMAWCAAAPGGGDPAAEVARKAGTFVAELLAAEAEAGGGGGAAGGEGNGKGGAPGPRGRGAGCRYARLVLGCRRPSAFQEAINPSAKASAKVSSNAAAAAGGKKGKSKKGAGEAAAATGPSDVEREEAEERYERAVLSALCGLGHLLDGRPEGGADAAAPGFPEAAAIARLLHSARGPFRRGAYALAGKMCARAPSRVRGITAAAGAPGEEDAALLDLGGAIPALLAAEKEPSNFGPLLEMVLGYLAVATKARGGAWGDDGVDAGAFARALGKALRRGCGGAPAAAWGPTMLPLVASLPCFPGGGEADAEAEGKPLPLLAVASLVSHGRVTSVVPSPFDDRG